MLTYRKFLSAKPTSSDLINWTLTSTPWGNQKKEIVLEVTISDGNKNSYAFWIDNEKMNTMNALAPVNALIDGLSKAALEFAKACNTPVKVEEKKAAPKKKAKSDTPKK